MYCINCGSMMNDDQQFCSFCKAPNPKYYGASQFHGQVMPRQYNNLSPPFSDPAEQPADVGLVVLSAVIPIAGLIIGCICLGNNETRAGWTYLLAAGISFAVFLLLIFVFVMVPFLILFR